MSRYPDAEMLRGRPEIHSRLLTDGLRAMDLSGSEAEAKNTTLLWWSACLDDLGAILQDQPPHRATRRGSLDPPF